MIKKILGIVRINKRLKEIERKLEFIDSLFDEDGYEWGYKERWKKHYMSHGSILKILKKADNNIELRLKEIYDAIEVTRIPRPAVPEGYKLVKIKSRKSNEEESI